MAVLSIDDTTGAVEDSYPSLQIRAVLQWAVNPSMTRSQSGQWINSMPVFFRPGSASVRFRSRCGGAWSEAPQQGQLRIGLPTTVTRLVIVDVTGSPRRPTADWPVAADGVTSAGRPPAGTGEIGS